MNKKYSLMIIIILLVLSLGFEVYAVGPTLTVNTTSDSAALGNEITLDIFIKDAIDIYGGDIILDYDSSTLEFISKNIELSEGTYIDLQDPNVQDTIFQDSQGKAHITFGLKKDINPINGEVKLATLTFNTLSTGDTNFSFNQESKLVTSDGSGGYQYISSSFENKTINIYDNGSITGSISGSLSLNDGIDSSGIEVGLYQGVAVLNNTMVDSNGSYSFENLEDGAYIIKVSKLGYENKEIPVIISNAEDKTIDITLIRIPEDTNRDGGISLEDLIIISNSYNLQEGDAEFNIDADINGDKEVNLLDLIYITRKLD